MLHSIKCTINIEVSQLVKRQGDMSLKMLGGQGYDPLVQSIRESGKQFTGESREVYTNWISNRSKDNEFEIQFGII